MNENMNCFKQGKKLSIIIPIYNTEMYLKRCLDSVKKLTYPVEIILIDDGSVDNCGKICDEYTNADLRFKVIHQKNMGLVETRKVGIQNVTSPYFTFIDSDDYIDNTEYDNMLYYLEKNNVQTDVICLGMSEEYQEKCTLKINKFSDGIYLNESLKNIRKSMLSYGDFFGFGILPNTVCKIYNTEFVQKNGYIINKDVTVGEDADMTYQLILKAKSVYILNQGPYHYCRRRDSMMWEKTEIKKIENLELDLKNAFEKSRDFEEALLPQLKKYIYFVYLICNPWEVLKNEKFFESDKDRIAVYGAGGVGRAVIRGINKNFTLWVDKNYALNNEDNVKNIDSLIYEIEKYDKIFIAISNLKICKQVMSELNKMGVDKPIYYFGMNFED